MSLPALSNGVGGSPLGQLEWLETNELGSFALGNVDRKLRRKYHALLTVRDPASGVDGRPRSGAGEPWNVLAEVREQLERPDESATLVDPISGLARHSELVSFHAYPHARHRYRALDAELERCVRLHPRHDQVELHYRVRAGRAPFTLGLEPLLRCRPWHALTQENPFLDGTCERHGDQLQLRPYLGMPAVALRLEGARYRFEEQGSWQHVLHYDWEAARGYPTRESLFSPGRLLIDIDTDLEFCLIVALEQCLAPERPPAAPADLQLMAKLERAAAQFFMRGEAQVPEAALFFSRAEPRASTPVRAAPSMAPAATTQPPVDGASTSSAITTQPACGVIAGFPWFGVWSRDALIALPGLYLASLDWERCAAVLETLAAARIHGLVPNLPALAGAPADTSAVDASLLYVRCVQWFTQQLGADRTERFMPVVCQLLEALADGSDPRMRFDHGVGVFTQPGPYALTWMDALIDGQPVTPRAGYAVDIDALAYNAAHFACGWADLHHASFARAFRARLRHAEGDFIARYWDDVRGYLADTHDGHAPDASLRPNQLWALALPYRPISGAMARASLQVITRELLTPVGLRTLARHDRAYRGRYAGTQPERDRAYHQGTVWPWLLGLYADAVRATHGHSALAARLGPALTQLARHLDHEGCIGQISEVFDAEPPHAPGGTPAQAWSVAETYRTVRLLHDVGEVSDDPLDAAQRGKTQPSSQLPFW